MGILDHFLKFRSYELMMHMSSDRSVIVKRSKRAPGPDHYHTNLLTDGSDPMIGLMSKYSCLELRVNIGTKLILTCMYIAPE